MARLAEDSAGAGLLERAQAAAPLRLEILSDRRAVFTMADQLEALCQELCEPNVFYEPWMLLPALAQLGDDTAFTFLCLYERAGAKRNQGRLCGFFPLVEDRLHALLPLPGYGLWQHSQCFRCTPLLRRGFAERCWQSVFAWLAGLPAHRRLLRIRRLPVKGPVYRALSRLLEETPAAGHFASLQETAFLHIGDSQDSSAGDEALSRAMSSKSNASLQRKLRRLQESGAVTVEERAGAPDLEGAPQLDNAIEAFLRLEASGWKGKAGTALEADPRQATFFREVAREAQRRGRLSLLCLCLDGRMIAGRSLLLAPPGSFVFKIAFDEALARHSPGMLLEMEAVRRLHDPADPLHGSITWSDSCAAPDDGPFYRCWPEREPIADLRLTSGWAPHRLAATLWPLLRRLSRPLCHPLHGRALRSLTQAAEKR